MPARFRNRLLQGAIFSEFVGDVTNRQCSRGQKSRVRFHVILLSVHGDPASFDHTVVVGISTAAAVHVNEAKPQITRVRVDVAPGPFNFVQAVRHNTVRTAPEIGAFQILFPAARPQRTCDLIQIVPLAADGLHAFQHLAVFVVIVFFSINSLPARFCNCLLQYSVGPELIGDIPNHHGTRHQ